MTQMRKRSNAERRAFARLGLPSRTGYFPMSLQLIFLTHIPRIIPRIPKGQIIIGAAGFQSPGLAGKTPLHSDSATGFQPDYSWLDLQVFDRKGRIRHDGGVVDSPGIYVTGLPFMRRRKSSFIHGAEDDARELSCHLGNYLDCLCGDQNWPATG